MRTLGIAGIQTKAVPGDLAASWDLFRTQVLGVRQLFPHVQMVVVPELTLMAEGALLGPRAAGWTRKSAVPIPGELALETGLWLVPGSVYELADDGEVYNTALAVAPDGRIAARYRKVFPWQPYEDTTPGGEFVVFDVDGVGRVGLAICYDGSFPETVRQLAWLGAEVVVQPTMTSTRDREMELVCARANAWTNQVFLVNVNAADPAGVGRARSSTRRAWCGSWPGRAKRCWSTCSTWTWSRRCGRTGAPG